MHRKINAFLEKSLKLRINRVYKMPRVKNHEEPGNLIIEFFGTSGVGKSTFCKRFNEELPKNLKKMIKSLPVIDVNTIINFKTNQFYEDLLNQRIQRISFNDSTGSDKIGELINFKKKLINDFIMTNAYENQIFLLDEGILIAFRKEILEHLQKNVSTLNLKNRLFVHCTASPEFIYSNINKRALKGTLHPVHKRFETKSEFIEFIKRMINRNEILAEELVNNGMEVITINIEEDFVINIKKVRKKMENLINELCL